jgi:Uri superfamily endonuclease
VTGTVAARGHYLLLLERPVAGALRIGVREAVAFAAGWYVYVGSAQGAGGLAARLARHQRQQKRRHWQIDWLLAEARLAAIWVEPTARGRECGWAGRLEQLGGRRQPAGFGSGDCRCAGHLLWFADRPDLGRLGERGGRAWRPWPDDARPTGVGLGAGS